MERYIVGILIALLVTITLLSRFVYATLKDYIKQKKAEKDPISHASAIPNLKNTECWEQPDLETERQAV